MLRAHLEGHLLLLKLAARHLPQNFDAIEVVALDVPAGQLDDVALLDLVLKVERHRSKNFSTKSFFLELTRSRMMKASRLEVS